MRLAWSAFEEGVPNPVVVGFVDDHHGRISVVVSHFDDNQKVAEIELAQGELEDLWRQLGDYFVENKG